MTIKLTPAENVKIGDVIMTLRSDTFEAEICCLKPMADGVIFAHFTNGRSTYLHVGEDAEVVLSYTFRTEWLVEDQEYVGLVAEFPSLSWCSPDEAEALAGIKKLVNEVVAEMIESGEAVPQ